MIFYKIKKKRWTMSQRKRPKVFETQKAIKKGGGMKWERIFCFQHLLSLSHARRFLPLTDQFIALENQEFSLRQKGTNLRCIAPKPINKFSPVLGHAINWWIVARDLNSYCITRHMHYKRPQQCFLIKNILSSRK